MYQVETAVSKDIKKARARIAIVIVNRVKKIKILGLTISEWLRRELAGYTLYEVDIKANDSIKDKLAVYCANCDYIMIINNNMPYITASLVDNILEYVVLKGSNACKLFSGAIYNTKSFLNSSELCYDNFYMQSQEAFLEVNTDAEVSAAERFFSKKLIGYYTSLGVQFHSPNSVIISPLCQIGCGTIIMNNCVIIGKSVIGQNCVIHNNTTIDDSKIGDATTISNSIVTKSKIGNNVLVSPYCNVIKSTIGDNSTIGYYCAIEGYRAKKNSVIKDRTTYRKEAMK